MEALPEELKQLETKRIAKNEGIQQNTNRQPINTEGKVTGSSAVSATDFAFLMQKSNKHGKGSKSTNFKEAKKANIRRNEKYEREA